MLMTMTLTVFDSVSPAGFGSAARATPIAKVQRAIASGTHTTAHFLMDCLQFALWERLRKATEQ